jgi:hypothetical protein
MTVRIGIEEQRHHFIGLSSDSKPTTYLNSNILPGSTFIEQDTGDEYMYSGVVWFRMNDLVKVDTNVDVDTSYIYNLDGSIQQIVETGLGRTKTTVFTWSNGVLQSAAVVLV